MDWDKLHSLHEDGRLEAKLATHGKLPGSLWQSYSSFANTNGGIILLGVAEDTKRRLTISGVPNAPDLISQFWNNANDGNTVSANLLVDENVRVETADGKDVVVISVPRAPRSLRPVFTGKNPLTGTWRRKGEGDYRCPPDEVRAMLRDQGDEPVDGTIVEEMGLDAIDGETLNTYRNLLRAQRPGHPWLELPDDEFLWKLGAADRVRGEKELHPTRAGLLMFGTERFIAKEFSNYLLDFRHVSDGTDGKWDDRLMSADGTWPGNVLGFWTRVIPKLVDGLPMPFTTADGITRIDDTPLRKAVREAAVNALGHADYLGRGGIVIIRHSNDAIEFRNPGCLRIDRTLVERGGLSDARNPIIMKMFNLIGIGEKAGSGFDTMQQGTRSAGLPAPTIVEELSPDRITLTLPITIVPARIHVSNPGTTVQEGSRLGKETPLTEREADALALFAPGTALNAARVAEDLGVSTSRARVLLGSLVSKGRLVRRGGPRSTVFLTVESHASDES